MISFLWQISPTRFEGKSACAEKHLAVLEGNPQRDAHSLDLFHNFFSPNSLFLILSCLSPIPFVAVPVLHACNRVVFVYYMFLWYFSECLNLFCCHRKQPVGQAGMSFSVAVHQHLFKSCSVCSVWKLWFQEVSEKRVYLWWDQFSNSGHTSHHFPTSYVYSNSSFMPFPTGCEHNEV